MQATSLESRKNISSFAESSDRKHGEDFSQQLKQSGARVVAVAKDVQELEAWKASVESLREGRGSKDEAPVVRLTSHQKDLLSRYIPPTDGDKELDKMIKIALGHATTIRDSLHEKLRHLHRSLIGSTHQERKETKVQSQSTESSDRKHGEDFFQQLKQSGARVVAVVKDVQELEAWKASVESLREGRGSKDEAPVVRLTSHQKDLLSRYIPPTDGDKELDKMIKIALGHATTIRDSLHEKLRDLHLSLIGSTHQERKETKVQSQSTKTTNETMEGNLLHNLPIEIVELVASTCEKDALKNLTLVVKKKYTEFHPEAMASVKLLRTAVAENPDLYWKIDGRNSAKKDMEIIRSVLKKDPSLFFSLSPEIQKTRAVCLETYFLLRKLDPDDKSGQIKNLLEQDRKSTSPCLEAIHQRCPLGTPLYELFFEKGADACSENPSFEEINILDRELILAFFSAQALKGRPPLSVVDSLLKKIAQSFSNDREIILAASKDFPSFVIRHVSLELQRTLVENARKDEDACFYALDPKLKADRDLALSALKKDVNVIGYVDQSLKKDPGLALLAVKKDGLLLRTLPEEICENRKIVLAAVTQNGKALEVAAKALRKNREIVLAAVTQNGKSLQYAAKALRKDREIVLAAVTQNGKSLKYAAKALREDHEIKHVASKHGGGHHKQ